MDDVRWLATVGTDYGMIAVRADSPWKSLKDLLTAMEKDPNSVVIGAGASIGSRLDESRAAGAAGKVDPHKMRYVAFEGGGEPVTALMGNHVRAVSGDLSEMVPYLSGDKIRVLAVFSENRLPGQLADVPTAKEQGYNRSGRSSAASSSGQSDRRRIPVVGGYLRKTSANRGVQKQRDLRGLFEFNLNGKQLDEYVKNR